MQHEYQRPGLLHRTIQQRQKLACSSRPTGQGRHIHKNLFASFRRQLNRPHSVSEGLQITADPWPALLKR